MEEIFELVNQEIIRSGHESFVSAGIVLTGGTAELDGIVELAEQVFNLPVRVGCPSGITGLVDVVNSPMFATGVGLVCYGSRHASRNEFQKGTDNVFFKISNRMKGWIKEFF